MLKSLAIKPRIGSGNTDRFERFIFISDFTIRFVHRFGSLSEWEEWCIYEQRGSIWVQAAFQETDRRALHHHELVSPRDKLDLVCVPNGCELHVLPYVSWYSLDVWIHREKPCARVAWARHSKAPASLSESVMNSSRATSSSSLSKMQLTVRKQSHLSWC